MGTIGRNIKYVGYDLSNLSIESHKQLRAFLGGRITVEPEFHQADSSTTMFMKGDLIFTSPPYDSTELYYGVNSRLTKTASIVDNIFRRAKCPVVLNVPLRVEEEVTNIAKARGFDLIDSMEMKTASFMGREKTHEPILVFKKR